MTSRIQMNQSSENVTDDVDVDIDKQKKLKEKLKSMGVMPSSNKGSDTLDPDNVEVTENVIPASDKSRKYSPFLVTVLLAFSTAGVLAYFYMPQEIAERLSFNTTSDNSANENDISENAGNSIGSINRDTQQQPGHMSGQTLEDDYRTSLQAYQEQTQRNRNEWLASQRAEFEKRRAEFMQQNSRSQFNQRGFDQPGVNQPGINQPGVNQPRVNQPRVNQPGVNQTGANQLRNNQPAYDQPQWVNPGSQEPPQWVIDSQLDIEKQRAQYLEEIKQQDNRYNNRYNRDYAGNVRPEYFNHPRMNLYQSQQDWPVQNIQPQQPEMAYQQNQRQYYRPFNYGQPPVYNAAPNYRYAPYASPYAWKGRAYR